jgi:Transposase, Mutator family
VKSAEGEIEFALPQLADMTEPFRSKIREVLRGRTEELERLLVDPVLVITDGAPGMIRTAEEVFPRSLRQGCLAHKIRNLQSKVPEEV